MNPRELACVLAALRLWQDRNLPDGLHPRRLLDLEQVIATEHGPSLDAEEIDALCERLNGGEEGGAVDVAQPLASALESCLEQMDQMFAGGKMFTDEDRTIRGAMEEAEKALAGYRDSGASETAAPRIIVEVKGGCVVAVHCSDERASAVVMDRDNLEDMDADDDEKADLAALESEISTMPTIL